MLVKKYSNRRLYDTESSRYVTLEELAERVRAGADMQVVDAKTGEDLTQSTLAQIILESRGASKLLPVPLLLQLVRMGDDHLADFFGAYLANALELYLTVKRGTRMLSPLYEMGPMSVAQSAFTRLFQSAAGGWGQPAAPPPPPPPETPRQDDIAALRREMEELKRAMKKKK